jgi:hypothetical protein
MSYLDPPKAFTFESEAKKTKALGPLPEVGVWTDGIGVYMEDNRAERGAGFWPAHRLVPGKRYRITIEEID